MLMILPYLRDKVNFFLNIFLIKNAEDLEKLGEKDNEKMSRGFSAKRSCEDHYHWKKTQTSEQDSAKTYKYPQRYREGVNNSVSQAATWSVWSVAVKHRHPAQKVSNFWPQEKGGDVEI